MLYIGNCGFGFGFGEGEKSLGCEAVERGHFWGEGSERFRINRRGLVSLTKSDQWRAMLNMSGAS